MSPTSLTTHWLLMRLRRWLHVQLITHRLQCLRAEADLLACDIDLMTDQVIDTKEAIRQCEAEMRATMVPLPVWPKG